MSISRSIKKLFGRTVATDELDDFEESDEPDDFEESDEPEYESDDQLDAHTDGYDDPKYYEVLDFIRGNRTASRRAIRLKCDLAGEVDRVARIIDAIIESNKIKAVDDPEIYDTVAYDDVLKFVKKTRILSTEVIGNKFAVSKSKVVKILDAMEAVGALSAVQNDGIRYILM
jgi:DNA segregation ATPase FtsK/SpoIIIE-like protein